MKITYDKEADAMYVYVATRKISHTVPVNDRLLVDVDKNGNTVGIEILEASSQKELVCSIKENVSNGVPLTLLSP